MASKTVAIKNAHDPIHNPEVIKVASDVNQVVCDGGHPVLGHPKTYYNFDNSNIVECGYCDRQFVRTSK